MGEYIKTAAGEVLKLGTCENLYYVTFRQAWCVTAGARTQPGNLAPAEYLNPKYGWRYRFPFPDEDDAEPGTHADYDRGFLIAVPWELTDVVEHRDNWHASRGHSYNVNIEMPCPATLRTMPAEYRPRHSPLPGVAPIEIVQQQLMADFALWTVCRCYWCGSRFRLSPAEGEELARLVENYGTEFHREMGARVRQGYARAPVTATK